MENYSALSRDKTFRRKIYGTVAFGIIVLIAMYVVLFSVENFFGGSTPQGQTGSSYATIKTGNRAWSELLSVNGYDVIRDRGTITLTNLPSDTETSDNDLTLSRKTSTVVVLSGALPQDESEELKKYVEGGGRLITDNPYLLNQFFPDDLSFDVQGFTTSYPTFEAEGLDGISRISSSGVGRIFFQRSNDRQALLSNRQSDSIASRTDTSIDLYNSAIFRYGSGDVVALVDIGPVSNQLLAKEDNALFALRIAGSQGSDVTFVEGVHGYDDTTGFAGMPLGWRVGLIGILASFVLFACSQGRRFGVGEEPNRNLGPRRIYFAHAIANALKKSKR